VPLEGTGDDILMAGRLTDCAPPARHRDDAVVDEGDVGVRRVDDPRVPSACGREQGTRGPLKWAVERRGLRRGVHELEASVDGLLEGRAPCAVREPVNHHQLDMIIVVELSHQAVYEPVEEWLLTVRRVDDADGGTQGRRSLLRSGAGGTAHSPGDDTRAIVPDARLFGPLFEGRAATLGEGSEATARAPLRVPLRLAVATGARARRGGGELVGRPLRAR
jgi:hypothetical protein